MATGTGKARQPIQPVETEEKIHSDPRLLEEEIRERADEIWLAREGQNGSDVADWLQAEQEVLKP